jgi:hypothetical protein
MKHPDTAFIIRIYHDAQSHERQIRWYSVCNLLLYGLINFYEWNLDIAELCKLRVKQMMEEAEIHSRCGDNHITVHLPPLSPPFLIAAKRSLTPSISVMLAKRAFSGSPGSETKSVSHAY